MNEKTDHPQLIFNPVLLVVIAIILALLMEWLVPLPFLPKSPSHIISVLVFLAGFAIASPAARRTMSAKTSPRPDRPTTALICSGTFRFTRNPIYLSMLFNLTGILIFLQNLWFVPILPFLIWLLTIWVILPEEKYLEGKFGQDYLDYKTRVHRWL